MKPNWRTQLRSGRFGSGSDRPSSHRRGPRRWYSLCGRGLDWPRLLRTRLRGATAALRRWREALLALISRQEVFYLAAKLLGGGITARRYVVSSWQQNETRARDAAGKGSPDVERSDAIALNFKTSVGTATSARRSRTSKRPTVSGKRAAVSPEIVSRCWRANFSEQRNGSTPAASSHYRQVSTRRAAAPPRYWHTCILTRSPPRRGPVKLAGSSDRGPSPCVRLGPVRACPIAEPSACCLGRRL